MMTAAVVWASAASGDSPQSLPRPAAPSAPGTATIAWWVEARPWTCAAQTGPLAREIQLACDAVGGCAIAPDERIAVRRAVLVCEGGEFTLEAHDGKGAKLWSLALGAGDDDDRLRRAAVWIARSEGSGPLVAAPPLAAPPAAAPSPTRPASVQPVGDADATPRAPGGARFYVAGMLHGARPTTGSNDYGTTIGGRAVVAVRAPRLAGPVALGLSAGGEANVTGWTSYSLTRAGLLASLGAPFDASAVLGVSLEGGPSLLSAPANRYGQIQPGLIGTRAVLGAYGQASLYLQWPGLSSVRPFVAPTFAVITDYSGVIPNGFAGIDIGAVWGSL